MSIRIFTDQPGVTVSVARSKTPSAAGEPMAWVTVDDPGFMVNTLWLTKVQAEALAAALLHAVDAESGL